MNLLFKRLLYMVSHRTADTRLLSVRHFTLDEHSCPLTYFSPQCAQALLCKYRLSLSADIHSHSNVRFTIPVISIDA